MSFDTRERSVEAGQPIRLYEFQLGALRWRFTGGDRAVLFGADTFESIAISDDGIRQSGETSADEFVVTLPFDNPVPRMYRLTPPATEIGILVRDLHIDEPETRLVYIGTIQGVKRDSAAAAKISCQSDLASLERPGLRLGWTRTCTHALYDTECKVSPALHAYPGLVLSLTPYTVESGAWALVDAWGPMLADGYVEWDIGEGETDRRGIEDHNGTIVTLIGGTDGIELGMTLTAHPGCPRTGEVCLGRFNNLPNHGGIPCLQGESPFDGRLVF